MVVVAGVHNRLSRDLWTPEAFERDFGESYNHPRVDYIPLSCILNAPLGEELADLVDCRNGLVLQQLPSRVFWSGFSKTNCELQAGVLCVC